MGQSVKEILPQKVPVNRIVELNTCAPCGRLNSLFVLVAGFACVISPLYFGGNRFEISYLIELCALWLGCGLLLTRENGTTASNQAKDWVALQKQVLIFCVILFSIFALQLVPLPTSFHALLSGDLENLGLLDSGSVFSISLTPYLTLTSSISASCYILCFLGLSFTNNGVSLTPNYSLNISRFLLGMISLSGGLCALIALLHWGLGIENLFGVFPGGSNLGDPRRIHWPFTNPNHLAGLLIVASSASLTLLVSNLYKKPIASLCNGVILSLCLIGCALTYSRLAIFITSAVVITLLLIGVVELCKHSSGIVELHRRRKAYAAIAFSVLVLVSLSLGGLFFVLDDQVFNYMTLRANLTGDFGLDPIRQGLYQLSFLMLGEHWMAGVGFGNWAQFAGIYAERSLGIYQLDYAHSDPLQFVCEMGLIFSFVLLGSLLMIVFSVFKFWRNTKGLERFYLSGCIITCICLPAQSLLDFPLHIPSLILAEILALAALMRYLNHLSLKQYS